MPEFVVFYGRKIIDTVIADNEEVALNVAQCNLTVVKEE